VASNAYRQAILEVNPQAQVWQVGCPAFVPLIEQGRLQHPETRQVAAQYLQPLIAASIDALVYGCTHYPHLEPVFRTLLSEQVQRIDPAAHLVAAAARELTLLNLKTRWCSPPHPLLCQWRTGWLCGTFRALAGLSSPSRAGHLCPRCYPSTGQFLGRPVTPMVAAVSMEQNGQRTPRKIHP
jgi:glutamate racemase